MSISNESNRGLWIGAAVVVVVIAGLAMWYNTRSSDVEPSMTTETNQLPANGNEEIVAVEVENDEEEAAPVVKENTTTTPPKAVTPPVDNSYATAIKTYKYRLQFVKCHGTSSIQNNGTLTVKKNAKFMLDNRDSVKHSIALAGQTHGVAGYKWVITSIAKSGTYNVTCDGGGAATIIVED